MVRARVGVIEGGNGEIGDEYLVNEGRILEEGRVAERERRLRRSDEVGVDVLGLIAIFEDEVLEEGVCGERGGEEAGGEERGRVGEDGGVGLGEDEGAG